jgi:DNA-binding IclR family transcriptional regulator
MTKEFAKVLALPAADEQKSDRQFVTALARGLEVLRAFRPEDGPLGNQELAERTGLPKPTVSRITHTLTTLGYLDYIARLSRYTIAASVLSLGHACVAAAGIRSAAAPHLRELAEYADASVALGARDRLMMIYLDVSRGSHTVAFSLDPGARIPIHRSAMGAAYLSALPAQERDFLMSAIAKSLGDEWPATQKNLETAFAEIEADGFCVFEGTYDRAMNGVGTALVQADGSVHAFSCSAPVYQFPANRLRGDIGPRLVAMREAVKASLGRPQW